MMVMMTMMIIIIIIITVIIIIIIIIIIMLYKSVYVVGYTGASRAQSPSRSINDARGSFRTDAHGRPAKKVIHEVVV